MPLKKSVPTRKVIAMERVDDVTHRLKLSCGHFLMAGDPVRGVLPRPESRKCTKCSKRMKREFVPPRKKKEKNADRNNSHH